MQGPGDLTFNPFCPNRFLDARPPASGYFLALSPQRQNGEIPINVYKDKIHESAGAIHEGKDRIEFDMTIVHWQRFFERSLD